MHPWTPGNVADSEQAGSWLAARPLFPGDRSGMAVIFRIPAIPEIARPRTCIWREGQVLTATGGAYARTQTHSTLKHMMAAIRTTAEGVQG